jgi:hypothetical protein
MPAESYLGNLAKVGANPMLPKTIDPNNTVNELILKGLKQIILVPVEFKIALDKLAQPAENNGKQGLSNYLIEYYFDKTKNGGPGPVQLFSDTCAKYKLPRKSGVKLFINDESVSQETFTNDFGENVMMTKLNSFQNPLMQSILQSSFSIGGSDAVLPQKLRDYATEGLKSLGDITALLTNQALGNVSENVGNLFTELVLGRKISLPSIWNKSDYQTSFSLSVKLLSPYGSPECIKEHIIKPLLYLLILASPRTFDGLTHWKPNYIYVNAFGVTNINLAYIDNISIRRGGNDVAYNLYKQPLMIDVQVSFKSALPGFAVLDGNSNITPRADFGNASQDVDTTLQSNGPGMVSLDNIIMSLRPYGYHKKDPDEALLKSLGSVQQGVDRTRMVEGDGLFSKVGNDVGGVVNSIFGNNIVGNGISSAGNLISNGTDNLIYEAALNQKLSINESSRFYSNALEKGWFIDP